MGRILLFLVLAVGGLALFGHLRQRTFAHQSRRQLRKRLAPAGRTPPPPPDALPPVVRRYLARALPVEAGPPRRVTLTQRGWLRLEPGADPRSLWARQEVTLAPIGFVWDARVWLGPVPFYGLDSLIGDHGRFSGRLAGLVQVVGSEDRSILRAGLLRALGESPWYPQWLATEAGLRWEALGDRRARVTLTAAGETVTGIFEFDDEDRPRRFSADRERDVDGEAVPTPWAGKYRDYARVEGVEVPLWAQVGWLLPEGPFTYWQARLEDVRHHP